MIDKIKELEEISRLLEPTLSQRNDWNAGVQQYADEYYKSLEDDKTYFHTTSQGKGILDYDISEEPTDLSHLIEGVKSNIDKVGINAASGGHMGYIPGGGVFPSALGDYLAAVTNRYAGVFFAAPGAVRLENMLIRWMCRLMGFPENAVGNLTSGGSIANLIALVTARDAMGLKAKNFENSVIYLSEQAHHSVQKAVRIAGLSEVKLRYIPLDDSLRMSVDALEEAILDDKDKGLIPFFINASLGTTNTGAVDPIEEIADVASKFHLWFHVDGAYGGFFKLLDGCQHHFKGIAKADSITLDPHKSLFLPFGTGAVIVKNTKAVLKVHYYMADYMQDTSDANEELSPADVSPELTKHFRGLRMWLPLKLFGLKPFRAALEEKLCLARYFHQEIQKIKGFEAGPEPQLSVAMFRYIPTEGDANKFNQQLIEEIRKDGRVFLSSTTVNDIFWIRVAVLSFRTHLRQVDLLLDILKEKVVALIQK